MRQIFIRVAVRTFFTLTSRRRAAQQCQVLAHEYRTLLQGVADPEGRRQVRVPPLRGVDEDMRNWSLFMILQHNTIVNRSITAIVAQLANGESLHGPAKIDPKQDVMPTEDVGMATLDEFFESIESHLQTLNGLPELRGTATSRHPVFGPFDAHCWNCMFPFHLRLHLAQARHVRNQLRTR